jgi:predicted Zn-dependent protease
MRKIILSIILCLSLLFNQKQAMAEDGMGLLNDSETFETITKLIAPLCATAKLPGKRVNLYIVIDKEINAFVTQGGNLFINTGLITAFNDPDVLKGVVAHELAHLSSGHTILRSAKVDSILQQSLLTTLLGVSAAAAGSPDIATALILGGQHAAERGYMSYSREQETVADKLAAKYLHETGTTISGLTKLLESFNSNELYLSASGISPYMLTHPLSKERLKMVREQYLQEKNNTSVQPSSQQDKESYARIVAKLRAFLSPDSYLSSAQKDLTGFARVYGDAILAYRKSQFKESFTLIDSLIKQHPKDGYLYELKGQFLLETGQGLQAVDAYKKALELLGDKPSLQSDYAVVLINARELYKDRTQREAALNEAITILTKMIGDPYQRSPSIYRNLAIAYGDLKNLGYSNVMLAEEAILLRRNNQAKRFLEIARNYSGKDKKLQLKIEDISRSLEK